ncbi:MAG: LCP family protein [Thermomicrobiales bacterium]|nr:LCP family protein [Thermomicrobiales bacterium]
MTDHDPGQSNNDYVQRRVRRAQSSASDPQEPAHRDRATRYSQLGGNASEQTEASPTVSAHVPNPQFAQDLRRARAAQARNLGTTSRWKRFTRRKWFWPLVGIPGTLMLVLALILSPVLYSSLRAWRNVTVEDVEHADSAVIAQLNDAGTPELVERPTEVAVSNWNGQDRINILLLGADLSAVDGSSRTDTIMIVNIDPQTKSARILSIPRDVKVVIPGYGIDKINAAFALGDYNNVQGGGAGLMIRTIEANFGIPIHAFVQIDFNGFVQMVDTVGGIYVDVPYPILDSQYPAENFNYQRIHFPAGWQHMDGQEALIYARTRHQDGDTSRSARQQQVLLALRDQHLSADLITQLPQLITDFGGTVRTDISITDAIKLAQLALEIPNENIEQLTVTGAVHDDYGDNGIFYLRVDWLVMEDILSELVGYDVSAPGAAYMDPDYGARILVINGTRNEGLAGRIGTVLEYNGFWQISVDTAEDIDTHETSKIIDVEGNLGTSALVSELISVGQDAIIYGDDASSLASSDGYFGYDIIIILGDDAWDPAGDSWTLEQYNTEQRHGEGEMESTPAVESP